MSKFEWQESEKVQLISPELLKQWASQQDAPLVIDVRNVEEHKSDKKLLSFCEEETLKNIPITEFGSHINQLDPDQPTVLVCQVGQKSFNAASLLIQADFSCVYSLHGGMEALRREAAE
ncbi:MAG: rhodanese-like domain-containing protein [Kangiella sp.]|nr:rhodanese-like domain-containing protein [Kangiella sp.]